MEIVFHVVLMLKPYAHKTKQSFLDCLFIILKIRRVVSPKNLPTNIFRKVCRSMLNLTAQLYTTSWKYKNTQSATSIHMVTGILKIGF